MGSIDVLQRIAQCPGLYIGERNIKKLDGFLCGYAICLSDHGIEDSDEFYFQGFTKFVNDKYLGGERLGDERWTSVIPVSYTHLDVYKRQVKDYDDFIKSDCTCVILCTDVWHFNIYDKEYDECLKLYEVLKQVELEELKYITDENDGQYTYLI